MRDGNSRGVADIRGVRGVEESAEFDPWVNFGDQAFARTVAGARQILFLEAFDDGGCEAHPGHVLADRER